MWTGVEAARGRASPSSRPSASPRAAGSTPAAIRELARTIADAERAAVYGRIGTCTQEYGTLASWLVDVINVLTGHLDEPGGAMFPKAAAFAANTLGRARARQGHRDRAPREPRVAARRRCSASCR